MPSKQRSANWLPQEDKQLAKSWIKISTDPLCSVGQKRGEFFKQVAKDFNHFAGGVNERNASSVMHRPLGLVMSDLLADTKKAYYKQEGKQFMYEPAWNCLKKSDKWKTLAQSRGDLQETPSDSPPEPPTSATQPNKHHANTTIGVDSDNSWK
ncbi:hypothetical protein PCANC_22155 [Puccinia coronata f. sp. avenae]|uniref:No apical meristem-associated C-terminal domain-containing protein n=1 Tax=Puccinia coronata f. sp. avenae TaxID=200324 RepID=A0A2N5TY46_9BASI|nr:hypothetical protein PCANC_22155 [Puccinia coronata f. sp. avenae]PLW13106.1 hypothetical protein PCASD_24730 [Puccinia coronata f. sp. avenae]PLW30392.1 hypothetical protein PCASD_21271 [Puccinia coronata f. sp. avenae]